MDRSPVYVAWKPLRSTRHARRKFRWSDLFLAPAPQPQPKRRNHFGTWLALLALIASSGVLLQLHTTKAAAVEAGPRRILSGWLPYWNTQAALDSVTTNADLFTDASPFWYTLDSDGLVRLACQSCASEERIAEIVQTLHTRRIPVLPTITQVQDAPAMAAFLADEAKRAAHVRQIVGLVVDHDYAGIDLDYESMNYGGGIADIVATKDGFSQLAQELATALHAVGKKLSITVGARTTTSDYGNWPVYDYAEIGRVVDKFRIMTYDYGWSGGPVNPVAPYWWVEKVIAHATSLVPAGKVWLGVPSYGYDWRDGVVGGASALTYAKVRELQDSTGARRQWVETDATGRPVRAPQLTYRDSKGATHTVWYSDAASMRRLMQLVGAYKLGGAAMWALGSEDPAVWDAARSYAASIAVASTTTTAWTSTQSVRYGSSLRLKGRVTDSNGQVIVGRSVTLQQRSSSTASWVSLTKASTDANGQVAFTVTPKRGQHYRLVAGSTWASAGATSAIRSVAVARGVAGSNAVTRRNAVRTITTQGSIYPAARGVSVSQQRLVNNRWVTVATARTDTQGKYRLAVSTRSVGTPTLRVRVASTTSYLAGATPAVRVAVR